MKEERRENAEGGFFERGIYAYEDGKIGKR